MVDLGLFELVINFSRMVTMIFPLDIVMVVMESYILVFLLFSGVNK